MKTIKSKIMDIFKEISEDNSRGFADRKYLKEYLGSMVINYRRKSDKKLIMKIYKTNSKKGTEIFIDNTVYFLTVVDGITIIYNEYGKAVSISFSDGYEWNGETFVSQEALVEENNFRMKYQNFINNNKHSRDLVKTYNESINLLNLLSNTTCVCDTTKIYNNLNYICNYLDNCLHNNMEDYFNKELNKLKNINSSLENYSKKEEEKEDALKSLNNYYEWLLNLEKANKNNLDSNDYFFKLVCEMKNHINKLFKKLTITQKDWDLLDYYHTEIEKMLNNKEELTTNFSTKNRNTNVTIENIDLDDDNKEDLKKDESKKIFRKSTLEEKADYLTFKTLRKYGVDSYHFDADKINVKNAKKELKQFNNTQKKYEKLINKDHNYDIDEVSYAIYNTVKNAKEDLENTGINHENNNKEIFVNELRNNYDRTVYLKRQKDLKSSALTISNVKEILGNIPDESFNKIKENYRKVKRRLIGLGAGICAGVLAITSFGVGGYKNYQKNLKNNSLVYENNDISIYGNDNQIVNLNNKTVTYEENIAGFGAKVSEKEIEDETKLEETNKVETKLELETLVSEKETEAETKLEETDKVETKLELETLVSEKETEAETKLEETDKVETKLELEPLVREKETEAETKLEETEPYTEKIEEPIIVNKNDAIIENLKVLPEEENHDIDLETSSLEKLSSIEDEKDLLNTYKNELQNLEALLPQSNIELENVRNIGDVVNITVDANLQNDEYSLIKHSEGHQSIHKDTLPRVICSIIMSDGNSGFTAKTMEEAESLLEQGYYVAGYGVLNPYSKDASNLEGFFESEDVVGLVRK